MHIILGEQNIQEVSDKYVVLELDAFRTSDTQELISAFCLVENVPIHELSDVDRYRDLHKQLIKNYRAANWKFCEDALDHLTGRWNGEVDSFYNVLARRVQEQKQHHDSTHWDPAIPV
jgi:hypothetical protein